MKPKSIYGVVTLTAIFGSLIYAPLLWDPLSGTAIEWDEVPVCFFLTLIISFVCLLPFYGVLKLFQVLNWKQIPYDGWHLQALACLVYSFFILFVQGEITELLCWYLGYYPVGMTFFAWYSRSKPSAVYDPDDQGAS